MYDEPFYDKNDIIEIYANKRKALDKKDVYELFNILINFLKRDSKTQNQYAYRIPRIGVLYKPFEKEMPGKTKDTKNVRLDEMMVEMMIGKFGNILDAPSKIKENKEELQAWQNYGE